MYDRQAPLLTWPESVASRFQKWGRKWPEEEDAGKVQLAIVDYTYAYPDYVKKVYEVFRPFNYETGEGVVAAPPKETLLRPMTFDLNQKRPKLNEIWSAQERLWVQQTVLDVVDKVNRNATDWESAYLKEIKALEVGNVAAQDQQSLASGDVLEAAEPITAPDEPEEDMEGGGMMGMGSGSGSGPSAMMSSMMGSGMGSGSGGGMMGGSQESVDVLFLQPEGVTQYKILPIMITVLIDQDHIQDLLVELENSPMAIEVKEPELRRPQSRIVKPEKGESQMMGYGGMMGSGPGGMMGRGAMGYGGMNSMMMNNMMASMGGGRGGADMMGSMMPGMSGMRGMMAGQGTVAEKKGEDRRSVDRVKEREAAQKKIDSVTGKSLFDPYFNIVELTVYGQARFYNEPPPADEEESTSLGDAAEPGAEPAGMETPAAVPAQAGASPAEAPKAANPDATLNPAAAPAEPAATAPTTPAEPAKPDAAAPAETAPESPKS